MSKARLFMETTMVSSTTTAGAITQLLIENGATETRATYENGTVTGLSWTLTIEGRAHHFRLPVRVEPVFQHLITRRKGYVGNTIRDQVRKQAERVAWRQLYRWIEAQLAFIECGMVETREVFLPYMIGGNDQTVFQAFELSHFKALPAAKGNA